MGKPTLALLTIHTTLLSQVAIANLQEQPGELQRDKRTQVAQRLDQVKRLLNQASSTVDRQGFEPDQLLMRSVQFRNCGVGNWWRC